MNRTSTTHSSSSRFAPKSARAFRAPLSLGWYDITIFGLVLISGVGACTSIFGG